MAAESAILTCRACGTHVPRAMLACPSCRALVHKEQLEALAARANEATSRGELTEALEAWRSAIELLPRESGQHARIREKIAALSTSVDAREGAQKPAPGEQKGKGKLAAGAGAIGLLLWKLKGVALWLLSIGKPLLLGLTKLPTLLSMLLSVAVYWAAFGLPFAIGLIACIYIHEVGHVVALRRFGIAASAPMFIPGLGAVVRMKQYPNDPREDARVGLAGPRWGLGASLAAMGLGFALHAPSLIAIGRVSALLNLFNLTPLGSLDGGRGFRALDRTGRIVATAAIAIAWAATGESLLFILLLVAMFRLLGASPERGDRPALVEYVLLVLVLSALTAVHVPGVATPR